MENINATPNTKRILSAGQVDGETVRKVVHAETERLTRSEQEEDLTFTITGVRNPSTGNYLSLDQAIKSGIIDTKRGQYVDWKNNKVIPIPAAMSEGFIKVEYTTRKTSDERRSSVYIITIRVQRETRKYTIRWVIDSVSEKRLTVAEATQQGILDQGRGIYRNRNTGEDLSLADALDSGLLSVEFEKGAFGGNDAAVREIETKTYAVHSVVDVKNRKRVPYNDALQLGLIDEPTGSFVNSSTGSLVDVGEAIKKGFIKATVLKDPTAFDVPEENRVAMKGFDSLRKQVRVLGQLKALKTCSENEASKKSGGGATPGEESQLTGKSKLDEFVHKIAEKGLELINEEKERKTDVEIPADPGYSVEAGISEFDSDLPIYMQIGEDGAEGECERKHSEKLSIKTEKSFISAREGNKESISSTHGDRNNDINSVQRDVTNVISSVVGEDGKPVISTSGDKISVSSAGRDDRSPSSSASNDTKLISSASGDDQNPKNTASSDKKSTSSTNGDNIAINGADKNSSEASGVDKKQISSASGDKKSINSASEDDNKSTSSASRDKKSISSTSEDDKKQISSASRDDMKPTSSAGSDKKSISSANGENKISTSSASSDKTSAIGNDKEPTSSASSDEKSISSASGDDKNQLSSASGDKKSISSASDDKKSNRSTSEDDTKQISKASGDKTLISSASGDDKKPTSSVCKDDKNQISSASSDMKSISSANGNDKNNTSPASVDKKSITSANRDQNSIISTNIDKKSITSASGDTIAITVTDKNSAASGDDENQINSASCDKKSISSASGEKSTKSESSDKKSISSASVEDKIRTSSASGDKIPTSSASEDAKNQISSASGDKKPTSSASEDDKNQISSASSDKIPTSSASGDAENQISFASGDKIPTSSASGDNTNQINSASSDKIPTGSASGDAKNQISSASADKIPISSASGDKIPTSSASGDKIPTSSASGDKIPTSSSSGDKIPTSSASGDKIPTSSASGDKIPTSSASGDKIPTSSTSGNGNPKYPSGRNNKNPVSLESEDASLATVVRSATEDDKNSIISANGNADKNPNSSPSKVDKKSISSVSGDDKKPTTAASGDGNQTSTAHVDNQNPAVSGSGKMMNSTDSVQEDRLNLIKVEENQNQLNSTHDNNHNPMNSINVSDRSTIIVPGDEIKQIPDSSVHRSGKDRRTLETPSEQHFCDDSTNSDTTDSEEYKKSFERNGVFRTEGDNQVTPRVEVSSGESGEGKVRNLSGVGSFLDHFHVQPDLRKEKDIWRRLWKAIPTVSAFGIILAVVCGFVVVTRRETQ